MRSALLAAVVVQRDLRLVRESLACRGHSRRRSWAAGGRRAGSAAALLAALAVLSTAVPPAASAAVFGESPERTIPYDVRVRGEVRTDPAAFARVAAQTFADRRGWSLGGSLRFTQVPSGGAFTVWLASPAAMDSFASLCSARYSCQSGRDVVINDERWRTGTPTWPTVREYRQYVLNHELGHWLGLGHTSCPGRGANAPVMQQQSKGLGGCRATTWPHPGERRAAAAWAGVGVRPTAPALVAVDRAGRAGTEVHALDGARGYGSFVSHSVADLAGSATRSWTFRVADHDGDGVDDLYAVQHPSRSAVRVRVLSGASGYRSTLLDATTPLRTTDRSSWTFAVADQDGDGHVDLIGIDGQGRTGTEVHVLDGAAGLLRWQLNTATALHRAPRAGWSFSVGDHDRDGVPDLYALARAGASGRTEVHVLSGAEGFRGWLANAVTPLAPAPAQEWSFEVADSDSDGFDDLVAVQRRGSSGRTEVHVLDRSFARWVLNAATGLGPTTGEDRWSFAAAG